jgi:hypothetical protein
MKWFYALGLVALCAMPTTASAQRFQVLAIGNLPRIAERAPTMWGMSGMEIFRVTQTVGSMTPIMRTQVMDARTVEILSRTQAPSLRGSDVKVVNQSGKTYIVVRRYMLTEVTPQDARSEGTSVARLARKWASSVRRVFPQVAPTPNRFGT